MKKTLIFCIVSVLAVFVSCNLEEIDTLSEEQQSPAAEEESPYAPSRFPTEFRATLAGAEAKTAFDLSTGRITWITDDPIYMTNGNESMPLYVEEGGSTEAALYASEKVFEGNGFYAVYPFDNAGYDPGFFRSFIPSRQTYVKGGFASQAFPMVAICDNNRRFAFRNAASLLRIDTSTSLAEGVSISSMTISADHPMSGPISVEYSLGNEPVVDCSGGENSVTLTGAEEGIPFGEPINVIVAPGVYGNVRIRLTLSNGLNYIHDVEERVSVDRSAYRVITVYVPDSYQDLSSEQSANCYVITSPGSYKFKANIKGNGVGTSCQIPAQTEGISDVIVYHTDGKSFINGNFALLGDYIYFSTVEGELPTGTALVSVVNEEGQTLWSWHIWANSGIEDVTLSDGSVWLNMNLGAHQSGFNSEGYNGYYYQWGRKDPFLQKYTASTTPTALAPFVSHASKTDGSLENSIAYPHIFYGGYQVSKTEKIEDWSSYDDDTKVYDWWNANIHGDSQKNADPCKTMFDPCPPGYHVPVYYELEALSSLTSANSSNGSNGRKVEGKLFFPYTSYRYISLYAGCWPGGATPTVFIPSATPSHTDAKDHRRVYRMELSSSQSTELSEEGVRAHAVPVRCIKDGTTSRPVDSEASLEDMEPDDWEISISPRR